MSYRDNLTTKFAQSLSCGLGAEQKIAELSLSDEMIKLASGYTITDLSYDGITKFVSELFDRELYGLTEDPVQFSVKLGSVTQSKLGMGVENCTGEIHILLPNISNLIVPFAVVKGELIPFDVIQLGGERCPYTRENLGKIIMNLIQMGKTDGTGTNDGYVALEPRQNPTTTAGFLSNMLQVRSRGAVIPDAGGMFITASEKAFTDMMEKCASMKPFNWETVEKVAGIIADKKRTDIIKQCSDLGAESAEMIKTAATQSMMSRSQPWKKLSEIPDKTFIKIPEMTGGASSRTQSGIRFSMTAAYVIKEFDEDFWKSKKWSEDAHRLVQTSPDKKVYNECILVVTADHRYMMVPRSSDIICLESPEQLFSLKGTRFKGLQGGERVLFKTGKGRYAVPAKAGKLNIRSTTNMETIGDDTNTAESAHPETSRTRRVTLYSSSPKIKYMSFDPETFSGSCGASGYALSDGMEAFRIPLNGKHNVYFLEGPPNGIRRLTRGEAIKALAKDQGTTLDTIDFLMPFNYDDDEYRIASEESKCIALGGTLGKTFKSFDELEAAMTGVSTSDFDGLYKKASESETVTVVKTGDAFSVSAHYADKSDGASVFRDEKLTGMSESAAMGALIGFGFDKNAAQNIMVKATNFGIVTTYLPSGGNTRKIFGGRAAKIKKVVNSIKSDEAAKAALKFAAKSMGFMAASKGVEIATKQLVGKTGLSHSAPFIRFVFDKFASVKDEAGALSVEFEKKAVEHESVEYRNAAKALGAAHHFIEAGMKVIDSPSDYPYFSKIAAEVVKDKKHIEDTISGLILEKNASYMDGEFNMNPTYYTRAVSALNYMYELASAIVNE